MRLNDTAETSSDGVVDRSFTIGDVPGVLWSPGLRRSRRAAPAQSGLALFDAFASQEKTLLAFPGSHFRVPADRVDTRFFARQLGRSAHAAAEPG